MEVDNPIVVEEKNGAVDILAAAASPLPSLVVLTNGVVEKPIEEDEVARENVLLTITKGEENGYDDANKDNFISRILTDYRKNLADRLNYALGYPGNLDFDYGALAELQLCCINNCGDPFIEGNYSVHSKQFEVAVLDWFAQLWEIEKDEYWGYVGSGGTEGNLHGILIGREIFPDGVLYTSQDSHYSVFKAARMYRMELVKVRTLFSGEIDCADFKVKLLHKKNKPAIVNVNIGTTMKGAVDDLDLVIQTLEDCGFAKDRYYIHCDGALSGVMLPFVKSGPTVTFKKPIGSLSISGHKYIGCPITCSVQLTRLENVKFLSKSVEYIGSCDATIVGSRSGHAPIFLWYSLYKKGYKGIQKEVQRCHRNAQYLRDRLVEEGISAMLNEQSITVVFERPFGIEFIQRWQLACEGNIAHVVAMPHVTIEKLDDFVDELVQSRSTWYGSDKNQPPCVAEEIGSKNCACLLHK